MKRIICAPCNTFEHKSKFTFSGGNLNAVVSNGFICVNATLCNGGKCKKKNIPYALSHSPMTVLRLKTTSLQTEKRKGKVTAHLITLLHSACTFSLNDFWIQSVAIAQSASSLQLLMPTFFFPLWFFPPANSGVREFWKTGAVRCLSWQWCWKGRRLLCFYGEWRNYAFTPTAGDICKCLLSQSFLHHCTIQPIVLVKCIC